ncbi:tetratricopeptide repeat protein [Klugiella xanthotipulae]|nr:hypothetical protein [Klugiella xanthotipulae]
MNRTLLGVGVMLVLLLLYIFSAGQRAIVLISSESPVAVTMGWALAVLPLIALWALFRELAFGRRSSRLYARLAGEGGLPGADLPVTPSGHIERAAADAAFPEYRAEAEAQPERWQSWFRLGLMYDACGDRRRARHSIRQAIALDRASITHTAG